MGPCEFLGEFVKLADRDTVYEEVKKLDSKDKKFIHLFTFASFNRIEIRRKEKRGWKDE